ncbi:hypothetical protein [Streptomyces sp. L2]|uniref:hypothetical protein n=1 Tax=Streptomyces sp. L2 TaxID=2162665 RepID=UPI0010133BAB
MIEPSAAEGWVVTGHHRDVLTYVAPGEPGDRSQTAVGMYGRGKRDRDGTELRVIHVEDDRDAPSPV